MAYQRIEVLTGNERRRRYTPAEKARMVEEAFRPGVVVIEAARRFGVHESLLYRWRRLMTAAAGAAEFVPVTITPEPAEGAEAPHSSEPEMATAAMPLPAPVSPPSPLPMTPAMTAAGQRPAMEIALPGGARVRLDGAVDPALAMAVLAALAPSRRAP
ncbi:IS66-like element accessory protein TnpA [Azospirillum halopraeferens]|uniref:IS66-like element accessory protein TnpA n=1 Tax=Azospirillum halopraeferens TaxID=34010 RepID=UPI000491D811|nr:transposase [Azospirillum halopraeferens]